MTACTRRHVLITGASSGIGRATALRLSAHGCHVYAGVRKPADAAALAQGAAGEPTAPFLHLVGFFSALHHNGSPPAEVAKTVERALTIARPRARYLAGKNARRMALAAAVLPPAAQDALRRRLTHQPARASRVPLPS